MHGRRSSRAVLRYVRLSAWAQSQSLEASLTVKAEVAHLQAPRSLPELQQFYQLWFRTPYFGEVLVINDLSVTTRAF